MTESVEAAVRHEFSCYYLADELPAEMDDEWLQSMTRSSAYRMCARVHSSEVGELAAQLRSAAADRSHPLVTMIAGQESMLDWLDDDCWPDLQRLLSWLARSVDDVSV